MSFFSDVDDLWTVFSDAFKNGWNIVLDVGKLLAFLFAHPIWAGVGLVGGTLLGAWALPQAPLDAGLWVGAMAGVWSAVFFQQLASNL